MCEFLRSTTALTSRKRHADVEVPLGTRSIQFCIGEAGQPTIVASLGSSRDTTAVPESRRDHCLFSRTAHPTALFSGHAERPEKCMSSSQSLAIGVTMAEIAAPGEPSIQRILRWTLGPTPRASVSTWSVLEGVHNFT